MAMKRVKVYNDNPETPKWKETFKGVEIVIEYGKPIEMDFFDANEFKGQYFPMTFVDDGMNQDPKSRKMIRVEQVDLNELHKDNEKLSGYRCNACKKSFQSIKLLNKHSESHEAIGEEALDESAPRKEEYQDPITELARRGPGRPRSQATQE